MAHCEAPLLEQWEVSDSGGHHENRFVIKTRMELGAYVELPLPGVYTHSNIHLPVHVICGKKSVPTLFISAAIHGDEINGVEIIRSSSISLR